MEKVNHIYAAYVSFMSKCCAMDMKRLRFVRKKGQNYIKAT